MATLTPNIGLKKPAGSEYPKISDAVNDNADILDAKIGPVGNVSLQTQITNEATARQQADTSLNDNIAKLRGGLSYVEDGATIAANAAYTAGKFICWQGEMYRIKAPINATVTSGNWTTYLDKMDGMGGALSQINADLTSLNDSLSLQVIGGDVNPSINITSGQSGLIGWSYLSAGVWLVNVKGWCPSTDGFVACDGHGTGWGRNGGGDSYMFNLTFVHQRNSAGALEVQYTNYSADAVTSAPGFFMMAYKLPMQ